MPSTLAVMEALERQAGAPYRIQIATSATRTIRSLPEEEWAPIRHQLARIADLAGRIGPPPKCLLEAAGLSPPLFRFRKGLLLVLYDASPRDRAITVLHVLNLPPAGEHPLKSDERAY